MFLWGPKIENDDDDGATMKISIKIDERGHKKKFISIDWRKSLIQNSFFCCCLSSSFFSSFNNRTNQKNDENKSPKWKIIRLNM